MIASFIEKINIYLKRGYSLSEPIAKWFGIFGIINYPVFYFIFMNEENNTYPDIILRLVATILCLGLIYKDKLKKFEEYHYIYWLITVTFCLPFIATFLFLYHQASEVWSTNIMLGLFWLILVVDFITFLIVLPIGILSGLFAYNMLYGVPKYLSFDNLEITFSNLLWITITASLFSRKKEVIIQRQKLKELAKLNEELRLNEVELEKALEAKTEFLNNMSHEIRTPIQGFLGISENLNLNWNLYSDEQKHHYTDIIAKNAYRLASLIGNLLDLTKFNQGKIFLDVRKMSLNRAIEDIIDECNTLYIKDNSFKIVFNNSKELEIMADKERLVQVLRNLSYNAIKFNKNRSDIEIEFKETELNYDDGNKLLGVHFSIKDKGIGVPIEEIDSIFDPFVQSSLSKTKAGGSGLGLAICRQIINAHHGKIWVENNKKSEGATFHFILPLLQEEQGINHTIISEKIIKQEQNKEDKKTIMIIDDEETILATMEIILVTTGHQVLKANSGLSGLEEIRKNYDKINLIFLDLMMPDMYGLNVLKEIKENELTKNIPVIIQSGASDGAEKEKCFKLGAVSLINKPYTRSQILKEVERFIN